MRTQELDRQSPESARRTEIPLSVVPAIDAALTRFVGREIAAAAEVVDLLLDLRLLAVGDAAAFSQ